MLFGGTRIFPVVVMLKPINRSGLVIVSPTFSVVAVTPDTVSLASTSTSPPTLGKIAVSGTAEIACVSVIDAIAVAHALLTAREQIRYVTS